MMIDAGEEPQDNGQGQEEDKHKAMYRLICTEIEDETRPYCEMNRKYGEGFRRIGDSCPA